MKKNRFSTCFGLNCNQCNGTNIKRVDKNRYICEKTGRRLAYSKKRGALIEVKE